METNSDDGMFPYEDVSGCKACKHITLQELISEEGYAHHRSYGDLWAAAQEGCRLCSLIDKALSLSKRNLSLNSLPESDKLGSSGLFEVNTGEITLQWQQKKRSRHLASTYLEVFRPRPEILRSDVLSITIAAGENQNRAIWPQVSYAELGFYVDSGSLTHFYCKLALNDQQIARLQNSSPDDVSLFRSIQSPTSPRLCFGSKRKSLGCRLEMLLPDFPNVSFTLVTPRMGVQYVCSVILMIRIVHTYASVTVGVKRSTSRQPPKLSRRE